MNCKMVRLKLRVVFAGLLLLLARPTFAQERAYHSEVDDLFSIQKVTVLAFTDNLQGIYARPLEAHLISLVEKMHRWDYLPSNTSGPILTPEELEASPEKAMQVNQGLGVDAFFAGRVSKGPNGITVHLSMFLSKDGKLFSQAILKDYKQFDLADLKEQTQRLLTEIVARIPYSGRVLSRDVNRVTVDLGSNDGLQAGQMLSVIQIIKAERHPKFNFLIRTEKEIIGKIKVLKVDETLSFGAVVSEKEKGAIQKNAKIGPLDFVTYSANDDLSLTGKPEDALTQRDDSGIAFGKDASAWKPEAPPKFGQVGAHLGLSRTEEHTDLYSVGGLSGEDDFAPSVMIDGELWITPEWTFYASLKQGIISFNNPRSGSSPTKLSQQLGAYEAGFGYMIRLGPSVWSAHIEPFLGYFTSRLYTDAATPQAFNTMTYNGLKIGVRGDTPLGPTSEYGVGGLVALAIKPGLQEKPGSSGDSSSNNVSQIGVYAYKKFGERLKGQANLDFEMFSSNFSGQGTDGDPASSASERFITLSAGLYYMF